jgi:succinoglycan biosynthesis transport protein ExoP
MNTEPNQSEAKLHALDYWQVIRNRYGIILLAFFLVFMTATVITYLLPSQYRGNVQLKINRTPREMKLFKETSDRSDMFLPYSNFMQTQFEIIESRRTLERVIRKRDLVAKWNLQNETEAFYKLKRKINAQDVRGTDLINIEVYHNDPAMAAELAQDIAESYEEGRKEEEANAIKTTLETLKIQIQSQKDKTDASRVSMLDIMENNDIPDISGDMPAWMGNSLNTGASDLVRTSGMDVYEESKNIDSLRAQIGTLRNLTGDELIKGASSLGLNDIILNKTLPEYQALQNQYGQLTAEGLGRMHPKMQGLQKLIDGTRANLMEAAETVKASLETSLKMAEQTLTSVEKARTRTLDNSMDEKRRSIEYMEAKKAYNLDSEILATMTEQRSKALIDNTLPERMVEYYEKATPNMTPAKPNVKLNLAIGAVVGLIFGVGLAFFLEYLDTSVKSLEDVERYLEVPVLAVIPKDVGVLHKQSGLSPDAEAYRILRTNIEFNRKSADANAITVVSGGAGEGKSTTLVNLAYICAQGGYNTLMIDGDLRRPRLHTFFDINNSVGLTNYLTTDLMLEDVILQTPVDNLYFMPSGILPADAAGILNSRRMSELIADVKSRFDLVLIDSPPILGVSDASVLASECDLTMIVIQHRKLPRSMLVRVKQAIENVGGTLLGVVLNNVDVRSDNQYQYYTSYYTYYSPTNVETKVKSRIADIDEGQSKKAPESASSGQYEQRGGSADAYDDDQY